MALFGPAMARRNDQINCISIYRPAPRSGHRSDGWSVREFAIALGADRRLGGVRRYDARAMVIGGAMCGFVWRKFGRHPLPADHTQRAWMVTRRQSEPCIRPRHTCKGFCRKSLLGRRTHHADGPMMQVRRQPALSSEIGVLYIRGTFIRPGDWDHMPQGTRSRTPRISRSMSEAQYPLEGQLDGFGVDGRTHAGIAGRDYVHRLSGIAARAHHIGARRIHADRKSRSEAS